MVYSGDIMSVGVRTKESGNEILVVYSGDMSVGVGTKESGKLQENSSVQSHLVTVNAQFFS